MPFIKQENRDEINPILQQLWDLICPTGVSLHDVKGDINYCFFKILISLAKREGVNYANLSEIEAIPRDVAAAFHDFVFKPYEEIKEKQNGPVKALES